MPLIPRNDPEPVDDGSENPGATFETAIKIGSVIEEHQWVAGYSRG